MKKSYVFYTSDDHVGYCSNEVEFISYCELYHTEGVLKTILWDVEIIVGIFQDRKYRER